MTSTEQRYAQIEREALAVTWACERFTNYLLGMTFEIKTDRNSRKSLVCILGKKSIPTTLMATARVGIHLFEYNASKYMLVTEYFSRYIEIAKLSSTDTKTVINHLKSGHICQTCNSSSYYLR